MPIAMTSLLKHLSVRRYSIALLIFFLASGLTNAETMPPPASPKNILYVTRLNIPSDADDRHKSLQQKGLASDAKVRAHLESLGYHVTMVDQTAPPK